MSDNKETTSAERADDVDGSGSAAAPAARRRCRLPSCHHWGCCCPRRHRVVQLQEDAPVVGRKARACIALASSRDALRPCGAPPDPRVTGPSTIAEALAFSVCKGLRARGHDARLLQTRGALGDALTGTPWLLRHVSVAVVFPTSPPPPANTCDMSPPITDDNVPSSDSPGAASPVCTCRRCCLHPWVVDPSFLDHFDVPHIHTPRYLSALRQLPDVFVGPACALRALVVDMCKEMEIAYGDVGMPVPPWRRAEAVASKWALLSTSGGGSCRVGARDRGKR